MVDNKLRLSQMTNMIALWVKRGGCSPFFSSLSPFFLLPTFLDFPLLIATSTESGVGFVLSYNHYIRPFFSLALPSSIVEAGVKGKARGKGAGTCSVVI